MRVLLADKLSESIGTRLEELDCEASIEPSLKDDTLTQALERINPHTLVVRSTKVHSEHLAAAPALALIIRAGAGTNTIDVSGASEKGIYVANCPGKNAVAVAELAMGHLINLDRRISDNIADLRAHRWAKKEYSKARGLCGRTLALLGTGQIGQEVINRARAFGMTIQAWSRSLTTERAQTLGVLHAPTPLDACRGADALSIHLALNDDTRHLVNEDLLGALNPGAFVINTSRGEVIDQPALVAAIQNRGLRAGLDVYAEEPAASDESFPFPIADEAGVYGTHHIGASTEQASEAVGDEVVRIIEAFRRTGNVPNCVNLAQKTPATHVLVARHADEVGVLAGILDHLRQAGINIQEMENIIFKGAAAACVRIQLDRLPEPPTIERIEASAHVFATSVVALND